jgi:hypothetical protein
MTIPSTRRTGGRSWRETAMRALGVAALTFLTGCPCCTEGDLEIVEGDDILWIGTSIDLVFTFGGDLIASPEQCGGHWYVDGVEGGNASSGTITSCGRYTAPMNVPAEDVLISASEYGIGECADCCPEARRRITVVGP